MNIVSSLPDSPSLQIQEKFHFLFSTVLPLLAFLPLLPVIISSVRSACSKETVIMDQIGKPEQLLRQSWLGGKHALNEMRKRKGAFVNWRSDWDGGCVLDCTAGWWSYNWLWWFVLREVCLKEQNANSQSLTWWLLLLSQFQKLELAVLHQPAQVGVVLLPGHQASCFSLTKEREVPALLTLVSTSWKHYVKVAVKYVHSGRRLFLLGCTSTKHEFLKLIIFFPNMQQIVSVEIKGHTMVLT